jgi:hypothetical protein
MITALRLTAATLAGALLALAAAGSSLAQGVPPSRAVTDATGYGAAYWARPHNTYLVADYPSLGYVLDRGNRVVEIDIYPPDDAGAFPVKHDPGQDGLEVNNCNNGEGGFLKDCLADVRSWIASHPGQMPVTIQLDLKGEAGVLGWSDEDLVALNKLLKSQLGSIAVMPEQVRSFTGSSTLREGVYRKGWPTLGSMRGKAVIMITGGPVGDKNDTQEDYVRLLKADALAFVCPNAEDPDDFKWNGNAHDFDDSVTNGWVVCGNIKRDSDWSRFTKASAINRQLSNIFDSDADYFAKFHQMYLAVGWGASMISRDDTETWGGKLPLYGVRGSVPVVFDLKGRSVGRCAGLQNNTPENGEDITAQDCASTSDVEAWVYTDRRQLRLERSPDYCFDIQGGDPDDNAVLHLHKCDDGDSETWILNADGSLPSKFSGYCAAMPSGTIDADMRLRSCDGSASHFFDILPVRANERRLLSQIASFRKAERRRHRRHAESAAVPD